MKNAVKITKRRLFLRLFDGWIGYDDKSGEEDENDNTGLVPTTNIASDDEDSGGIGGSGSNNDGPGSNLK